MDVLADILRWLRVEGGRFVRTEMFSPWGMLIPEADAACFHIVEKGDCFLLLGDNEPRALTSGDVVILPNGARHALVNSIDEAPRPFIERFRGPEKIVTGDYSSNYYSSTPSEGGEDEERLSVKWSGGFSFAEKMDHPMLSVLPPLIFVGEKERKDVPWLDRTIQFLMYESSEGEQGSDMMIERLLDMLLIQSIRSWITRQIDCPKCTSGGWLGALRDDSIRHSLGLIHKYPEKPWTVETLGKEVGMSRSVFSNRFRALVGDTPLHYLTQWRMRVATRLLQKQDYRGLFDVALQVGYDSEISFSRAFKRYFKVSPGTWRRQHIS